MRSFSVAIVLAVQMASPGYAVAGEPTADAILADLPFERPEEPNRVYVNLAPEGNRPFVLMLDTGAQASVLTPLAARELGISIRRTKSSAYQRATGLGRDLHFFIDTSQSDTGSPTGFEFGVVGGNFLEHYVVELDFARRRVRFLDPNRFEVPEESEVEDETVLPLRVTAKRPFAAAQVNGQPIQVLIDTGAPFPVMMSGKAAEKVGIDAAALVAYGAVQGTVGANQLKIGEAQSFALGSLSFGGVIPVMVAPRGLYNVAGQTDSLLGYDTLQPFTVRLDYPRSRMWLKKRPDARITFTGLDYETVRDSGVFLAPVLGGFWVAQVRAGSSADAIGLRRGDIIVSAVGAGPLDLADTLARIQAGTRILVAREAENGIIGDVELGRDDPATRKPATVPVESEADRRAAFDKKQRERLFVFENGGWTVIEGYRRRRGPKDGETWVTYDEMQAIRSGQK